MKKNKINLTDILVVTVISFLIGDISRKILTLPRYTWISIGVIISILLISIILFFPKPSKSNKHKLAYSVFPLLVVYFCFWYQKFFGDVDVGALIFHLQAGLEGAAMEAALFKDGARYFFSFAIMTFSLWYLINKFRVFELTDRVIALPILLVTPFSTYLIGSLYYSQYHAILPSYFKDIDSKISLNNKPKNIILIYAESGERTYQHINNGAAAYAPMIDIASQGLEIVGVEQVTNTGWTVAGLIASQCGTPLQPLGLFSENSFGQRQNFLPGATCLSDVLSTNGYNNEFVYGGDFAFAGTDKFLLQHNFNHSDIQSEYKDEFNGVRNNWGLYDDTLFNIALSKTRQLELDKKPFFLSILTIGGHSSKGYPSQNCKKNLTPASKKSILFAVQCMGSDINQFINALKAENLLDNTLVVVMSDHLVMQTEVTAELKKHDRLNYLAFIGADVNVAVRDKKSATFDIYPTILELLGFDLPEGRAGLGMSLLSDRPTLVEQFGKDQLNMMIKFDKELAKKIWMAGVKTDD